MTAWREVIKAFGEDAVTDAEGNWSVSAVGEMGNIGDPLRAAPGAFRSEEYASEELQDQFGQGVDIESQGGRLVSCQGLAIVDWSDRWQAGLSATLTVHATRDAFLRASSEARSSACAPPTGPNVGASRRNGRHIPGQRRPACSAVTAMPRIYGRLTGGGTRRQLPEALRLLCG
jgi:hypothetical protein